MDGIIDPDLLSQDCYCYPHFPIGVTLVTTIEPAVFLSMGIPKIVAALGAKEVHPWMWSGNHTRLH